MLNLIYHSNETWKDIPGYEGIYQASTLGNIRTVEGKTTCNKRYSKRVWKSRILKGRGNNPNTGKRVNLYKDGKAKEFLVARLVALTFFGNPPEGFTVNHKDGNRMNNNVENLEWLSLADNIRHGFSTGLYHTQKPVTLKKGCQVLEFGSMAQCDSFLGRSAGYTSNTLKRKNTLFNVKGEEFCVFPSDGGAL